MPAHRAQHIILTRRSFRTAAIQWTISLTDIVRRFCWGVEPLGRKLCFLEPAEKATLKKWPPEK